MFFVCASVCASVFGGRLCTCRAFRRVFSPHFVDLFSNVSERALSYILFFCPAFLALHFWCFLMCVCRSFCSVFQVFS